MKTTNRGGQLLIVALMITAILVATVPILFAISKRLHYFYGDSSAKIKFNLSSQAALAQVNYALSASPELWNRAITNAALSQEGFDGSRTFIGVNKIPYTVVCFRDPSLLPNQLRVKIRLTNAGKTFQRYQTYEAILSRKTMGVDLPVLRHAPAALYVLGDLDLSRQQAETPELDVHWGAIVCFGTLTLDDAPNAETYGHHPRKFARGEYRAPYAKHQITDGREFWSQRFWGEPVVIDDDRYRKAATEQNGDANKDDATAQERKSSYISAPEQVLIVRSVATQPKDNVVPVLYVDASVRFETDGIDLGTGAMIVTENAIFEDHREGKELPLSVPPSGALEYPYLPDNTKFPCQEQIGASCSSQTALASSSKVDFRGFLYVKGDMYVNQDTTIVGVLRVDGQLHVHGGKRLTILFDDKVSRSIYTTGAELQQEIVAAPPST